MHRAKVHELSMITANPSLVKCNFCNVSVALDLMSHHISRKHPEMVLQQPVVPSVSTCLQQEPPSLDTRQVAGTSPSKVTHGSFVISRAGGKRRTALPIPKSPSPVEHDQHDQSPTEASPSPSEVKGHKCDQCSKIFRRPAELLRHQVTHSKERPYKCTECDKSYTQPGALARHLRSHTGDKPFVCEECGQSFVESGALTRHCLTHTKEKPFTCPVCQDKFTTSGQLALHKRTHSKQKNYICKKC